MKKVNVPEDNSSAVMLTDRHGGVRYLNEFGQLHRENDLPAVTDIHGEFYYKNGLLHRENGPAVINSHQEVYYKNGQIHRDEDSPAVIHFIKSSDGSKEILLQKYYKKGLQHRDNGPALMWNTGSYQYYQNGVLHNESGPACHSIEDNKITDEYCLNGKYISKLEHAVMTLKNKLINNGSNKKMKLR